MTDEEPQSRSFSCTSSKESNKSKSISEIDELNDSDQISEVDDGEKKETSEQEKKEEKKVVVDITDLFDKAFENREELKSKVIKLWGGENKMKLSFKTRETTLIKDGSKVSTIYCAKKAEFGCSFFLEFRTSSKTSPYKLASYWDTHNHTLDIYDNSYCITEEILNKIMTLKNTVKSTSELTETINKLFGKNFHRYTINNQLNKLKTEEIGTATDDAKILIKMLKEECDKKGGFYKVQLDEEKFVGCSFMSKRMRKLLDYFNDVLIIDVTHATNRFNFPFLDVALVNNYGQTSICFFSLMQDQKYQSFEWCLKNLKSQLKRMPKVIFSDDEEGLRKGKN